MKRYRKWLILSLIIILFFCLPDFVSAQTDPSDPGFDPDAPIDGGISILIAAGVGYGIKKLRDNKKNDNSVL